MAKNKATVVEMVVAVRAHANENYEHDGWDYVVEAWSDAEIAQELADENVTTCAAAIKAIHRCVKIRDEVRKDVQGEAW